MNYFVYLIILMLISGCGQKKKRSQGENFTNNVDQVYEKIIDNSNMLSFFDNARYPVQPRFQNLPTGSNKPSGWILEIMENDLDNGIVGALDELYPGIKKDDLYNTARRGGLEDVPEMGDLVLTGEAWEKSIMWWNAETIGNWWDGFVRHAFLTGNKQAIYHSNKIVENLLASQDEDGYIGIYKKNLRYQHEGSNGELWAQTTAFRMLLAYYELAGDKRVLNAVEQAMALTMEKYGPEGRNPFYLKNAFGGVTHGLMMSDVCETLTRITGNEKYQDYATYLYRAFSTYSINRAFNDLRYPFLLERDSLFTGHAVHTYEHLRSLINAYYHTGYPEMKNAFENAMYKLDYCLLPSGAGHGNEWIAGMKADPTNTSTEFCAMLELRNFYASAVQKTGNVKFADRAEKLTFNAIMGSRNESGTAITYGKGDNCYVLDGHHHGELDNREDPRYKYSPTHSDPAVCCVPNYSRNFTYYLDQMWLRTPDGLAATLYGPSELKTTVFDAEVKIRQITQYPLSDSIQFEIETSKPVTFILYFRKPEWSDKMDFSLVDTEILLENGYYKIEKEWTNNQKIMVYFKNQIQVKEFRNGEIYYQRGPLVFALTIPFREKKIKDYDYKGFADYHCFPTEEDFEGFMVNPSNKTKFKLVTGEPSSDKNLWYQSKFSLKGKLVKKNGNEMEVQLVPMGRTVLRKVTFKPL